MAKKSKEERLKEELKDYYALPDNLRKLYDEYMKIRDPKASTFVFNSFAKALSNYVNGVDRDGHGSKPYSERELKRLKRLGFNLNPETVEDVAKLFDKDPGLYLDDYPMEGMEDLIRDLVPELKDKSDEEVLEWYNKEEDDTPRKSVLEQYDDLSYDEAKDILDWRWEDRKVSRNDKGRYLYKAYKYKNAPIIDLTDEEIAEKYPDTVKNAIKARDKARAEVKEYNKKILKDVVEDKLDDPSKEVFDDFMSTADIHDICSNKAYVDYMNGPFLDKFVPVDVKEALKYDYDDDTTEWVDDRNIADMTLGEAAAKVMKQMDEYSTDGNVRSKFLEFVYNNPDVVRKDPWDFNDAWENSEEYGEIVFDDEEDSDPVRHERYEELADEMNNDNLDPIGDRTINEASQILPQDYDEPKTRSRQEAVDRLKDIHQQHKLDDNFDNMIAQLKLLREGKDSKESLMDYLDENYPEEKKAGDRIVTDVPKGMLGKKKEVEKVIEEHPKEAEIALESMGQDELAEEAAQVSTPDKRDDEVNDKVVKDALNEGYEDGMLKRSEEQQAEFDRIKAESDKAAEEWRKQQFDKFANPEPEATPKAEPRVETNNQPDAEPVQLSDDDIKKELERFSGNKKKHKGKGKIEDLEALEFNPEEFAKLQQQQEYEKKYGSKKPEEAIKEELSEDEMGGLDYKPSEEELKALHDANREEWIAKGRPRNDPDKSIEIDPNLMQKQAEEQNAELDKQVEKAIESNPEQAAESAPEGSNIEQEAEQAANPEGNSGEVNDAEIAEEPDATKQQFINDIEPDQNLDSYPEAREQYTPGEEGTPEFVTPDVASLDLSEDEMMGGSISNDEMQQIEAQMNQAEQPVSQPEQQSDATISEANDLPELELEQIPQEEIDRIFKPLNAEIEKLGKDLKDREDILELAQRHFDENPNDENAIALNKANQQYQDAQYLLNKRQDEYVEAYKNLGNYYQAKKPQEETPEEEKNTLGLHFRDTPLPVNAPNGGSNSPISISKHDTPRAGIGSLAGYGKPMNVTGSHGSAHGTGAPHSQGNPSYTSGAKTGMARPGVVTDNISARRAPVMTGRNSESQGYVNHNGGGLTSGGTRGGLWSQSKAALPGFTGHTGSVSQGMLAGGQGASKGLGSLRTALIARIHKRLNGMPAEQVRALGFSPKDHYYKGHRLEDLPGETLRQIADALEVATLNSN